MIAYIRFQSRLLIRVLLALDLSPHNILPNIVLLAQVEELPDFRCSLRAQTLRQNGIRQSWDLALALLDNNKRKDGNIRANDTASYGLALALTSTAGTVAGVAVRKKKTDTGGYKDTLLHGETLLVVSSTDTENVTLELITEGVSGNFLGDFLLVEHTTVVYELVPEYKVRLRVRTISSRHQGRWSFVAPSRGL